jgi:hypothetical protein
MMEREVVKMKNCCSPKETDSDAKVNVNVTVDVPKIVKCLFVTGVLIVGIIFGTKTFQKMMDKGFFEIEE